MSARSRLSRWGSATLVSALVAGAALLAAPAAYAQTDGAMAAVDSAPAAQAEETTSASAETPSAPESPAAPVEPDAEPASEQPAKPAAEIVSEPSTTSEQDPTATEDQASNDESAQAEEQSAETVEAQTDTAQTTAHKTSTGSFAWGFNEELRTILDDTESTSYDAFGSVGRSTATSAIVWNNGVGTIAADRETGSLAFEPGDGIRFQAHPNGSDRFEVDLQFTQPRIVLTSATTGELRFDIIDRGDTGTSAGRVSTDALLATLQLPVESSESDVISWTDAVATGTAEGSTATGGAIAAGALLDTASFSTAPTAADELTTTADEEQTPARETAVAIKTSAGTVTAGAAVKLTATITPKTAAGTVQFFDGAKPLGESTPAVSGSAQLNTTKLAVGTHDISAAFTPDDSAAFTSSVSTTNARVVVKPKPVSGPVNNATLTWGVRESFRNYIYDFTAFEGTITRLGTTKQPVNKGDFVWGSGAGTAMSDGSTADVSFGRGNGVYFRSHPIGGGYALDLQFTNPRVVVKTAGTGELRLDVTGRTFVDTTSVGKEFILKNVLMATLELPSPAAKGKTLTWSNAPATLTKAGADAFGGFYEPGETLDPVTFSLNTETEAIGKTSTSTSLNASAKKIASGSSVDLRAVVSPKLAGTIKLSAAGKQLSKPIKVSNGQAKASVQLPDGTHSVIATFTPDDDSYGHSVSNAVKITVEKKPVKKPDVAAPGNGAKSAGSLVWGISSGFADYATGPIAKGEVTTSGVGSSGGAYLFPQSGSTWNAQAQTGAVQYSGTVTFSGHKGLMSESFANPVITVTSGSQGTLSAGGRSFGLNLAAAAKSTGANGEVTWSGVPVSGAISGSGNGGGGTFAADGLSFTVGAASGVSYGSTSISNADKKRAVAETAPTTAGIRILTAADQITAGAELEFEADGFEASEREMIVALYPGPLVLDEAAGANDAGTVRWLGTLPDDIEPGEYTITVQGSTDAGAVFTVVDEKEAKAAKKAAAAAGQLADGVNAEAVASAGIAPPGTGPVWLWWVGAGSLLIIAAAMGGLVVMQRRAATQS